jgi:hypothetical protein
MAIRDSLLMVTTAVSGASPVNSAPINLGHDAQATGVGTPLHMGYEAAVYLPQNPTGTSPTITIWLQFQDESGNWSANNQGLLLLPTLSATTGFPRRVAMKFFTPPKTKAVRVQYVLGGTSPNYGNCVFSLEIGNRLTS